MDNLKNNVLPLAGRILICFIFVMSGFNKLGGAEGTIGYIASKGVPLPSIAYALAVIVELGGGLLILAGFMTQWAALALAVFCLFTGFVFHGFGDMNNSIHTMKNIGLAGGFLFVAAHGAGVWSLDALLARRRTGLAHA
jgi:putative oxidoreductase